MISLALLAAVSFDAAAIAQTSATLNALGPHPFGSPRNQAAAQFVSAKLQEVGLSQTTLEEFTFEGAAGTNVVANLPGRSDRLLIIAAHHDSKKDAQDVSGRSRSLSLLIEIGRLASKLRPAKTWIIASFDGGESKGEGFAHYLETLGKSRDLVDGGVVIYQGEFLPVVSWEDLPGTGRVSGSTVALAVLRPRLGLPIERLLGTLDELPGTWSSVTEAHPAGAWLQGLCHGEGQVWQVIDPDRLVALLRQYRGER